MLQFKDNPRAITLPLMVPYARYLLRHKQLTTNDYLLSSNKVHTAGTNNSVESSKLSR